MHSDQSGDNNHTANEDRGGKTFPETTDKASRWNRILPLAQLDEDVTRLVGHHETFQRTYIPLPTRSE